MNTVVLTPLFPPDTSDSARYTKELVTRMSVKQLSVVAYGRLHESVPEVVIYPISKRSSKIRRTINCLRTLRRLTPDVLIVQNGPSTEFSALLFSFFSSAKIVYVLSDREAAAKRSVVRHLFEKRVDKIISLPNDSTAYLPKEWLPFTTNDGIDDNTQTWWNDHLSEITTYHE